MVLLNERYRLPYISELIRRKMEGRERGLLDEADMAFHRGEYERLCARMRAASEASLLPEKPAGRAELNDVLIRVRLGPLGMPGDE